MSKIEYGSANVYADLRLENAEEMLGMTQPKLSNLLRGQFRGISEAKMLECLTRLGRNVEIVVKPTGRTQSTGHVSVVFA
ncbi:MAG: XRE family transcriptional regulator [Gallionella sp.]|nr:XRE family transcriptional regulator [Gallionella sp.]